jgi:Raf kinase inhibitor-like YbhB/YbcL family protein
MALSLTSPAFAQGGAIPERHSCEGKDVSPELRIDGVPQGAKSLALIVHDPDAPDPDAPKIDWVHWVVYNLPPGTRSLPEGVQQDDLPKGALLGTTDFKKAAYGGPCPPIGRHRYFFVLHALATVLPDLGTPTRQRLEREMAGHILGKVELMGTYEKKRK